MAADPIEARVEAYVREWIDVPPSRPAEAYAALLALVRQEREQGFVDGWKAKPLPHGRGMTKALERYLARLAAPQRPKEEQ